MHGAAHWRVAFVARRSRCRRRSASGRCLPSVPLSLALLHQAMAMLVLTRQPCMRRSCTSASAHRRAIRVAIGIPALRVPRCREDESAHAVLGHSASACSRSAMMSALSSMPIDSRTTSGPAPACDLLRVGQLAVRGRGRMDDQRAGVADIGEVREQLARSTTSLTPAS